MLIKCVDILGKNVFVGGNLLCKNDISFGLYEQVWGLVCSVVDIWIVIRIFVCVWGLCLFFVMCFVGQFGQVFWIFEGFVISVQCWGFVEVGIQYVLVFEMVFFGYVD